MRKILTVAIIGIIIFGIFSLWWRNGLAAVNSKDTTSKVFVIQKGAAVRTVGNELKTQGLIKDPVVFFIYIKQNKLDQNIQAGSYKLSPSMDLPKIMDTIGHGTVDTWVTIPEGLRSEEIAEILQREIPTYDPSWVATLKAEEGYLFPDTFFVYPSATPEQLVAMMQKLFTQKTATLFTGMNDAEVAKTVILASLLEREARGDDERAVIAGILVKRLSLGMRLQVDATVAYANGISEQELTKADFAKDSPYNTYLYKGLPPGPIANPGIVSLTAALHPNLATPYLYYLHDSRGSIHYAKTYAEHQANIRAYLR
jgi:UPF0755 protein